jgi:hypothetical protein
LRKKDLVNLISSKHINGERPSLNQHRVVQGVPVLGKYVQMDDEVEWLSGQFTLEVSKVEPEAILQGDWYTKLTTNKISKPTREGGKRICVLYLPAAPRPLRLSGTVPRSSACGPRGSAPDRTRRRTSVFGGIPLFSSFAWPLDRFAGAKQAQATGLTEGTARPLL